MDISIEDVKAFVASRGKEDLVGKPLSCSSCLVACTILWKYPGVYEVSVEGSNMSATVYESDEDFEGTDIDLPTEVEDTADRFDRLATRNGITRKALEEEMPELFN